MSYLRSFMVVGIWTGLSLVVLPAANANEGYEVTEVRVPKLTIYAQKEGGTEPQFEKTGELAKEEFKGPWPVLGSTSRQLQVRAGDKTFWVAKYQVKTNKPINVPAECGAVVTAKGPRMGSVRGLGEECSK